MHISSARTYLVVAILLLVLIHAFSFGVAMGMETDKQGQMLPCPFTVSSSMCTMGFSEHLSLWQSMFTATLDSNAGMLALTGFIILALAVTSKLLVMARDKEFTAYKFHHHERSSPIHRRLTELFSSGILNPKIYALATL